jgi:hypothetical protein
LYSFLFEAESTAGTYGSQKEYANKKIAIIPPGIDPTTFRLVAQYLNQLRHCVPHEKV